MRGEKTWPFANKALEGDCSEGLHKVDQQKHTYDEMAGYEEEKRRGLLYAWLLAA